MVSTDQPRGEQPPPAGDVPARRQRWVRVVAVVVGVLSLVPAGFCLFMASLMTYGLYSWSEETLDPDIWLPLLGVSLCLSAGPAVMALGRHRRRWLVVTAVTFLVVALLSSAATWLPLVGSTG